MRVSGRDFGRNLGIWGSKLMRFCGRKIGKLGEMLDPLATKRIHGSKSTKHHKNSQITKKIGALFGGDFRIRTKNNKIKLENEEGRLRNRDQRGS